MTWTKIGDNFADRADLLACSRSARLLHVEGLVYANRAGSDGAIPKGALRRMTDSDDPQAEALELVAHKVWETTETGWEIRNFTADQMSADEVERVQAAARKRQTRRRLHLAGDHSECTGYCEAAAASRRDEQRDQRRPSRAPYDRPPDPKGRGGQGLCRHGQKAGDDGEGDPYCGTCADERHTRIRLALVAEAEAEGTP